MKKALFRLDSGARFGLGHLMRSKALADALLEIDIEPTFAVCYIHSDEAVSPHQLIHLNDEQEFIALAKDYDAIIIDHYDYTSAQFLQLSSIKQVILVVLDDECNRGNLYADIVVNPAAQSSTLAYKEMVEQAKLLIGPEYILLKQSFQQLQLKPFTQRNSIVITFGGSDVTGLTLPVLKKLIDTSLMDFEIVVVTGASCEYSDQVIEFCRQYGFKHLHNVQNMAQVFADARFALSAAGTTAFELASSGTPAVFAVVADNQLLSVSELCQHGWCTYIDCRDDNKVDELLTQAEKMLTTMPLEQLSTMARSLIDGEGAGRVAACIKQLTNASDG